MPTPYRVPVEAEPVEEVPARPWWARLLCAIGWHLGPIGHDYHAARCRACGRVWWEQ